MNPRRVLMIVDVQRGFSPPPRFLKNLREYARGFPCRVFTQFVNPPGSMFRKVLKQKSSPPRSGEAGLLLTPEPRDLVFRKDTYGLTPAHIQKLRRRKITRVTVCGLDTDACVLGVMFSL